ncbi:MAG TPA: hypothetical protein VIJ00_15475 [Nakamurella sp.]
MLDVRLPDGNGIELCRELRSRFPELPCLMLTSFTEERRCWTPSWPGRAAMWSRTSRVSTW